MKAASRRRTGARRWRAAAGVGDGRERGASPRRQRHRREPPRHQADETAGTTSRRRRGIATPSRDVEGQHRGDGVKAKKGTPQQNGSRWKNVSWYPAPARRTLRNIGAASLVHLVPRERKVGTPTIAVDVPIIQDTPTGRRQQPPPRHALLGSAVFEGIRQHSLTFEVLLDFSLELLARPDGHDDVAPEPRLPQ